MAPRHDPKDLIRRVLRLVILFEGAPEAVWTEQQVATALRTTRSTALRYLEAARQVGYVVRAEGGWRRGPDEACDLRLDGA